MKYILHKYFAGASVACLFCFAGFSVKAQAPQGIPYQAIARNSSGAVIASHAVGVRFTIHDSVATGTIVYQETFTPTTNTLGLFNVNVGTGTVVSGTFSGINWGTNAKYMQVEMDPTGGTSYTDMGTQQMMSVPYALYAKNAGSTISSSTLQPHVQVFTSSGTFTTSSSITSATVFKVTLVGGGGSGGSGSGVTVGGGGGGAGATVLYWGSGLSPATAYTVTVGNGGSGATTGSGSSGGASSIVFGSAGVISAAGGGGGGLGGGGGGGVASSGTVNINGGNGYPGSAYSSSTGSGAGGSGGTSTLGGSGAYGSGSFGGATIGSGGYAGSGPAYSGIVIIEWME